MTMQFYVTTLTLCLAALSHTLSASPYPSELKTELIQDARPRNVVFILSDDHRYDAMSFMGHPLAKTPELDRLAANGAHLKNALVSTSLCSPSRASILTGLYTFRHRVIDNQRPVPENTVYFPQFLQEAGYKTALIGKWHMGNHSDEPRPGWDHWVSFRGQGRYLPPSPDYTLNVNGERVPQKGYITDELTEYAVDWLEEQRNSDTPFFLYLSHKAVHSNFTPADRHEGMLEEAQYTPPESQANTPENYALKPRWLKDQRNSWHGVDFPYHSDLDIEEYYKRYCETLAGVDDSVGRVMQQLESMGILEETLVIYMGDNGFMFGEHGLIDKRVAYETSIRVPMIAHCPELIAPGTVVEEVVANIDIAPTTMEAMGLQAPDYMDGDSFLPLLKGENVPWRDSFVYVYYWEKNFPQSPTVFALRESRYKYINYYGLWDVDELYDLQEDPTESRNLLYEPEYVQLGDEMRERLYARMEELGAMQIPLNAPDDRYNNKRLIRRGGREAADFPEPLLLHEPRNRNAN